MATASAARRRGGSAWATRDSSMDYRDVLLARTTYRARRATRRPWSTRCRSTNETDAPKHLRHYEVWDVARRPIETNWIVSGLPLTSVPAAARDGARRAQRDVRRGRRARRRERRARPASYVRRLGRAAGRERPERDRLLPRRSVPRRARRPDRCSLHAINDAFFGTGGPSAPDAVSLRAPGDGAALAHRERRRRSRACS